MNDSPLVIVESLVKDYDGGLVPALRDLSFEIRRGEIAVIIGPSGCGKSTLLSLIGLLDRPGAGRIIVAGQDLGDIRNPYAYRAKTVGFVFQFHHLIPTLTIRENVEAPMMGLGIGRRERFSRSMDMLDNMKISHLANFLPSRVSGGERQRAAVARALINRPTLVLGDEPTGNLDSVNGDHVMRYFISEVRARNMTLLLATHSSDVANHADRIIEMRDGKVVDTRSPGIAAPPACA